MIGRTNAGGAGGVKPVAYLKVEYPIGSSCICSKGTTVLSAKDTSGLYIFYIPEIGTWTVTVTDGVYTRSIEKVITANDFQSVVLQYVFDWNAEGLSGWSIGNKCDSETSTAYVVANVTTEETAEGYAKFRSGKPTGWPQGTIYLTDPIDFTAYTTLTMDYIYTTSARYSIFISIWSSEPNDGTSMATNRVAVQEYKCDTSSGGTFNLTCTLDVTDIVGSCYFGIDIETSGGAYSSVTVKSIHIE